jgi:hypothetical protein
MAGFLPYNNQELPLMNNQGFSSIDPGSIDPRDKYKDYISSYSNKYTSYYNKEDNKEDDEEDDKEDLPDLVDSLEQKSTKMNGFEIITFDLDGMFISIIGIVTIDDCPFTLSLRGINILSEVNGNNELEQKLNDYNIYPEINKEILSNLNKKINFNTFSWNEVILEKNVFTYIYEQVIFYEKLQIEYASEILFKEFVNNKAIDESNLKDTSVILPHLDFNIQQDECFQSIGRILNYYRILAKELGMPLKDNNNKLVGGVKVGAILSVFAAIAAVATASVSGQEHSHDYSRVTKTEFPRDSSNFLTKVLGDTKTVKKLDLTLFGQTEQAKKDELVINLYKETTDLVVHTATDLLPLELYKPHADASLLNGYGYFSPEEFSDTVNKIGLKYGINETDSFSVTNKLMKTIINQNTITVTDLNIVVSSSKIVESADIVTFFDALEKGLDGLIYKEKVTITKKLSNPYTALACTGPTCLADSIDKFFNEMNIDSNEAVVPWAISQVGKSVLEDAFAEYSSLLKLQLAKRYIKEVAKKIAIFNLKPLTDEDSTKTLTERLKMVNENIQKLNKSFEAKESKMIDFSNKLDKSVSELFKEIWTKKIDLSKANTKAIEELVSESIKRTNALNSETRNIIMQYASTFMLSCFLLGTVSFVASITVLSVSGSVGGIAAAPNAAAAGRKIMANITSYIADRFENGVKKRKKIDMENLSTLNLTIDSRLQALQHNQEEITKLEAYKLTLKIEQETKDIDSKLSALRNLEEQTKKEITALKENKTGLENKINILNKELAIVKKYSIVLEEQILAANKIKRFLIKNKSKLKNALLKTTQKNPLPISGGKKTRKINKHKKTRNINKRNKHKHKTKKH